jgi:uncharacterized protein (TIGR02118 family)
MFKLIILLTKRAGMEDEEFARHFLNEHAPLAKKMLELRRYVVNIVQKPPDKESEFHGIAELWFDDRQSMKKAFSSLEGQATQKDTERFASKTISLYIEEHETS